MRPSTVHNWTGRIANNSREIAAALGVKAVSRMRKADLVEAIVSATAVRATMLRTRHRERARRAMRRRARCGRVGRVRRRPRHDRRGRERARRRPRSGRRHGAHPAPVAAPATGNGRRQSAARRSGFDDAGTSTNGERQRPTATERSGDGRRTRTGRVRHRDDARLLRATTPHDRDSSDHDDRLRR